MDRKWSRSDVVICGAPNGVVSAERIFSMEWYVVIIYFTKEIKSKKQLLAFILHLCSLLVHSSKYCSS
jgi:hypothetical protein